ncbi:hypothetical protein D3227_25075 [Mesorhizobium waimense]|uniref:Uncharacterized protein n=1 Tax=Mesorhizobium waimense TaxID=1300307 RepID=A0A3A5KDV2_9HYPH|nr:hypothetical protein [Mesorhizobium waimense]RJT33507.1 hypothetical protein D3227_25075 [Mesorhizobium waimense]
MAKAATGRDKAGAAFGCFGPAKIMVIQQDQTSSMTEVCSAVTQRRPNRVPAMRQDMSGEG